MLRIVIVISLALVGCYGTPAVTTDEPLPSCDGHNPDKFFIDPKNPKVFYQCKGGIDIRRPQCVEGKMFDEELQYCVSTEKATCPKPDGFFEYPGDRHKFIQCVDNVAYIRKCDSSLIFSVELGECVYDDKSTYSAAPITFPPTTVPPTTFSLITVPLTTGTPTTQPLVDTTAKSCHRQGLYEDPDDPHKFHMCVSGKEESFICPIMVFNKQNHICE